MTIEQKLEAFKAEHPDAFQAIFDQGFKSGESTGGDAATKSERERVDLLVNCPTFSGHHEFVLSAIRDGHELGRAKSNFADLLAKENADLRKQQAESARRERLAGTAYPQGPEFGGSAAAIAPGNIDAKTQFEAKVKALVDGGKPRMEAVNAVAKSDPALYQEYMASFGRPPQQ